LLVRSCGRGVGSVAAKLKLRPPLTPPKGENSLSLGFCPPITGEPKGGIKTIEGVG